MHSNKYTIVGWLAVAQAILFPLSITLAIVEKGVATNLFDFHKPFFGPSDVLGLIFTAIAIYVLWMFKNLLNDHYEYHDLDLLILISIWWAALFQVVGLGLGFLTMIFWPVDEKVFALVYIVFFASSMICIGIVDILIAVKLLKVKEHFSEYIRAFAYITIVAGICEITVFLSPITLLMIPVTCIILALIFFKDKRENHTVDYV